MKESTKDLFRVQEGWGPRSLYRFLHAYWYLTKTDHYVRVLVNALLFVVKYFPPQVGRWACNLVVPYYHGKVVRTEDIKKVITLNADLRIRDSIAEQVIPFEVARKIVIENPDHIVVTDCACRKFKGESSCSTEKYGIQLCMFIGEPFVSFTLEHSKNNPSRITAEEALERFDDVRRRGWVSSMFFKDAMGERAYAICNCCSCCCIGLKFHREVLPHLKYPVKQILASGYLAIVDREKCIGCQICKKKCPFDAYAFEPDEGKVTVIQERCMGCGACVGQCKAGALSLVREPQKGTPLDIDMLRDEANPSIPGPGGAVGREEGDG